MATLKKCKGTGKAKGEGCGQDLQYTERGGMKVYFSKFGLGTSGCRCFYNWFESNCQQDVFSNKVIYFFKLFAFIVKMPSIRKIFNIIPTGFNNI